MVYHCASPLTLTPCEPTDSSAFDLKDQWTKTSKTLRFLLHRSASCYGYSPQMEIMVVNPSLHDSHIIGTLEGLQGGMRGGEAEDIGNNWKSLNASCKNDPKMLSFMRKISSSPAAAEQFMRRHPQGKSFVLQSQCMEIFGVRVNLHDTVHPLLVGVQYVLTNPGEVEQAGPEAGAIQRLLKGSPDLGVAFRQWISTALELFISNCDSASSASTMKGPFYLDPRPEQLLACTDSASSASTMKGPFYLDPRPEQLLTRTDSASTVMGTSYFAPQPEQPLSCTDSATSASTMKGDEPAAPAAEKPRSTADLVCRLRVLQATIEQLTIADAVESKDEALAQIRSAHFAAREALMKRFDELVEVRRALSTSVIYNQ
jgi:hypothetical protein